MKLYHYSNNKIKDYIKPSFFGNNSYTKNDIEACSIARAFYYLDKNKIEYRFKDNQYLYIVKVNKNLLYDLRQDKNGLLDVCKYNGLDKVNIDKLFKEVIKRGYIGAIYNIGLDYVVIFKNLKFNQVIKTGQI